MYVLAMLLVLLFNQCSIAMVLPAELVQVKIIDYKKAIAELGQNIVNDLDAEPDVVRTVFYLVSEVLEHGECPKEIVITLKEMLEKLKQPHELVNQSHLGDELRIEDKAFTMIHERIAWFDTQLSECQETFSRPLKDWLGKLIELYKKFVLNLVKTNDLPNEERLEVRRELLAQKVNVCLDAFGDPKFFLIPQSWARQLGNVKEDGTRLKERASNQTHDTYKSKSGKVFFKSARALSPSKPEYELAVYSFFSILFPHIRVITPSCFLACNNVLINGEKQTFYFQATTTIDGITLGKIMKAVREEDIDEGFRQFFDNGLYKNLNFESFSALVLGGFVINPSDWKPENLIVQKNGTIVGIDNDEAFVYPLIQMLTGVSKDFHYVAKKNILCFMKEFMSEPIHPRIAKRLQEIEPQAIIREWLTFLQQKERVYEKLKKYAFSPDPLYEPPLLSIKFAPDIIKRMVIALSELKSHAAAGQMTHQKIFYKMHEFVMRYYQAIAHVNPKAHNAYAEINAASEKDSLEHILNLTTRTQDGRKTFKVLRTENHTIADYENKSQGIDVALSDLNEAILSHKGQTKLHEAVSNALKEGPIALACLEELQKLGTDFEAQDKEENTALDIAFGASREHSAEDEAAQQNRTYAAQKLINWNAGKKIKMHRALDFFAHYQDLGPTVLKLESTNAEFAWRRLLQEVFSEQKVDGKECRITCFNKKRYVSEKFCNQLWDKDNKFKPKNRCVNLKKCTVANCKHLTFGRREVSYIEIGNKKMWFKRFPNVPGFEHAVSRLIQNLIGNGSTFNELVFINNEFYMVSFGIEGDNLQELFNRPENKDKNPECLDRLDPQATSALIVTTMLVAPEDGKPDNIQVDNTHQTPRLVCIDNENSFFPAGVKDKETNVPFRAIKSIVFCLNQMKEKVHPTVLARFLEMEPAAVLTKWLQEIEGYHNVCLSMKLDEETGKVDEKIHKLCKDQNCYIGVPFAPGMLNRVYDKFVKLRDQLQENPNITHIDLLIKLYPPLEKYKTYLNVPLTVYNRFKEVDLPLFNLVKGVPESRYATKEVLEALTIPYQDLDESVRNDSCFNPSQGIKEIEQIRKTLQNLQLGEKGEDFAKLEDGQKEKYLETTDFSRMKDGKMIIPLSAQETLFKLDAFKRTPWDRLTIKTAEGLTVPLLTALNLAHVTRISLSGCKTSMIPFYRF